MAVALILSSYVASSRVGGSAQALALAQLGIDPVLAPTVLYGRHPGWGPPGGAAVSIETFESLLGGIVANGVLQAVDLVITGYFVSAAQARAAAAAIDAVRAAPRAPDRKRPLVVVDPIMGDSGKGLYVKPEIPDALAAELLLRADVVAPNAWELERLTGVPARDPSAALGAARRLGRPTLVSSVERGDDIGVVYADTREAWLAVHARLPRAPNGVGDLLTALFAAALADAQPPADALARAVGGVAETVAAAAACDAPELPIAAMGGRIGAPSARVRIERLA